MSCQLCPSKTRDRLFGSGAFSPWYYTSCMSLINRLRNGLPFGSRSLAFKKLCITLTGNSSIGQLQKSIFRAESCNAEVGPRLIVDYHATAPQSLAKSPCEKNYCMSSQESVSQCKTLPSRSPVVKQKNYYVAPINIVQTTWKIITWS